MSKTPRPRDRPIKQIREAIGERMEGKGTGRPGADNAWCF